MAHATPPTDQNGGPNPPAAYKAEPMGGPTQTDFENKSFWIIEKEYEVKPTAIPSPNRVSVEAMMKAAWFGKITIRIVTLELQPAALPTPSMNL